MWNFILPALLLFTAANSLLAQPIIYNDSETLVTGFWNANGTLAETSNNAPYEGTLHYEFVYNLDGYYAGFGLNFANWGNSGYNFTGYSHLRLAYRGLSSGHRLRLQLRSAAGDGNTVDVGIDNGSYTTVDIPIIALIAGTDLTLNNVTEISVSVGSDSPTGSGSLYLDNLRLVDLGTTNITSSATWQRANAMHRGVNYSNWLEAYWLMPFNAYPEVDKFDADITADFRSLGFDAIRLPVTFENLAADTPPYTLDTSNPAFGLIDDAVVWAANNNMKLIIDMHHGDELTDANYLTELPRLEAIWSQIIDLYGELDPDRYLFEVYNEPHAITNANFRVVAEALVDVVRAAGATHSIIVGATGYNGAEDLLSFTPLDDPDIIYTFHFYEPYLFTHQQMSWTSTPNLPVRAFPLGDEVAEITARINAVGEWSAYYNAPVVAGEFGVSGDAPAADRCEWVDLIGSLFDANGLPWFYWGSIDLSDGFGFFDNGVVSEATMEPCFGTALGLPATVLAVEELGQLSAQCEADYVRLEWYLKTDEPGHIRVEGLTNDNSWQSLGDLNMQAQREWYAYIVDGQHIAYRLLITELDGSLHYSDIVVNECAPRGDWRVFPNPSPGHLSIRGTFSVNADILIYDGLGRLVQQVAGVQLEENTASPLPLFQAAPGIYFLEVRDGPRVLHRERVVLEW